MFKEVCGVNDERDKGGEWSGKGREDEGSEKEEAVKSLKGQCIFIIL